MSFYNTYRPKTFEELDNEQVRSLVTSLLTKKKEELPHAYFLTGPRGIGKTTAARIIAKLFNCTNPSKTGEPCGICDLCVHIGQGNALDVLEMDAASNTGVDNIRDLKDKIMLAPSQGKWKVYIIDEVHMLSTGAFNALLKTLEEPPMHTVFVLATTDAQKVPETIQSRCLLMQFKKPDIKEIVAALSRIVKAEKLEIDTDSLVMIAEAADGSFRDATKLLEQASLSGKKITPESVKGLLSLPESSQIATFIALLQKKDVAELLTIVERFPKEGVDTRFFYTTVLKELQHILISHIVHTKSSWTTSELTSLIDILLRSYTTIRNTILPELALELAILEYCKKVEVASVSHSVDVPVHKTPERTMVPPPKIEIPKAVSTPAVPVIRDESKPRVASNLTFEKLTQHWNDFISELKPLNNSISGVLRSTRPKSVTNDIVTIEAFYTFHKDKLSEVKAKEAMSQTIKKLFGDSVSIEIVLGKK